MPAGQGHRARLQRNRSPEAAALWATPSAHEWFVMFALRTRLRGVTARQPAKRLLRNIACRVSYIDVSICGNTSGRLRARRKIFREQAGRIHARHAKRPDDF